jgi:hypothetical protein
MPNSTIAPALLLALTATATASAGAVQDNPVEELLRLHHRQRVAHVLADARALAESFDTAFVELNRGSVGSRTPDELRERFTAYFAGARFLEWEDVRPPRIRLSPDGRWADVIVEKRVRTIPADTTWNRREDYATFAWLERWVRGDSAWRLAAMASTDRPVEGEAPASLADRVRAYEILSRARAALGGEEAVARVATLRLVADCEGPRGPFRTTVASARDGRVALLQEFPSRPRFAAGIGLGGGWQRSGDDPPVDSLDAVLGTVVTGHEVHLLALAPEARFTAPVGRPSERLDGRDARVVRFVDALGAPVDFLYDAGTGRPLGFRLVNHTGRGAADILTRFEDWRRVGDVLLPFVIAITQGDDVYRYTIVQATTDWLTERAFRPADER